MSSLTQPSLLDATTDYTNYGIENEQLCQDVKEEKEYACEAKCDVKIHKYTQGNIKFDATTNGNDDGAKSLWYFN